MSDKPQINNGVARRLIAFCEQPWRVPTAGLAILVLATFAWGFSILGHYEESDYFDLDDDLSISEFLFRNTAGGRNAQGLNVAGQRRVDISEAVAPGVVGVGAGGVNMPMLASGTLVSSAGHVLTTLHSLDGVKDIDVRVRTPSGVKRYKAEIVKTRPEHDLALLKILTTDRFLFFPLAETSNLKPGSTVFAVGNGRTNNGAVGDLVSRQGRILGTNAVIMAGDSQLTHLLTTDAIYSWAQGGGPLINEWGQMVGINLSMRVGAASVEGYAIPAHVILAHFQDVITFKLSGQTPAASASMAQGQAGAPVSVQAAAQMPRYQPPAQTGGSAAWWSKARAQISPNAPSALGMNVVAPMATAGQGTPGAAQPVPGPSSLFDAEHLGVTRIAGYPISDILGLALLGLAAGLISGMMTMGGGILHVAGMMIFFGYGMHLIRPVAYLTNLFVFGAASRRNSWSGLVMWDTVRNLVPWAVLGVVIGYFIGNALDDRAIGLMLGLFAALMTFKGLHEIFADHPDEILVKGQPRAPQTSDELDDALDDVTASAAPVARESVDVEDDDENAPSGKETTREMIARYARHAGLGLPLGLVSGMLGISGGVVAVPLQRFFGGRSLQNAIANSSVIVFWASGAGAIVAFVHGTSAGLIEWQTPLTLAAIMIPGAFVGGLVGAKLMNLLPTLYLKWFYTVIMAVIAVKMLFLNS